MRPWRLLVTGGGTGGHIYPALAIAGRASTGFGPVDVLYVGSRGGLEATLAPRAGIPFKALPVTGLIRRRPVEVARGLARVTGATGAALSIVRRFRPHVVVATGGYAAGPVGAATVLLRMPLILQEQNVIPGVTNRLLSPFAVAVAVPYPDAREHFPPRAHLWPVGNPVRPEVLGADRREARARLNLPPAGPVVVFYGGSRGSAVFVRLFKELLPEWPKDAHLLFISGEAHHQAVPTELPPNVTVLPYLHEMGDALAAADLIIGRAGGMTLAEMAAVGLPAVIIPSPHVTHHHQEANAAVFARAGAALVSPEAGLDGRKLAATVKALLAEPGRLQVMSARAAALGRATALDDLVSRIHDTVRHRISRRR